MKPTKARLDLLQAIADGAVEQHYPLLPDPHYDTWDQGPGQRPRWRKVTGRVAELHNGGYIKLLARVEGEHYKAPRGWDLTPAGRMYLEANGGGAA